MPTIHVEDGLSFRVFTNDHEPPHVHVVKDNAVVLINLGDSNTRPTIREIFGMKRVDVKKALRITAENQDTFLEEWGNYHDDEA